MDKNDVVLVNARKIIEVGGLKQKAVAERASIPINHFYAIMTGRKQLTSDYTLRIAKALGVTPNELFQQDAT